MSLHLITPPARRPLTLIEAKAHLRVDHNDDDAYIDSLIDVASAKLDGADGILSKCLVQQTWELRLGAFPTEIEIPLPPLASVTSVKYIDTSGVEQTLSTSDYDVFDQGSAPALIQKAFGVMNWPSTRSRPDAVKVRFVAGYASVQNGALVGTIPRTVIHAMLLMIGTLYAFREEIVGDRSTERTSGTIEEVPGAVKNLLGDLLPPGV